MSANNSQKASEQPTAATPVSREVLNLCGNCWRISHPNGWWGWNDVDGVPEDTDGDPSYYRCPSCGFDHRDDDADPGVWDGTREELVIIRLREQEEFAGVRNALLALNDEIAALYDNGTLDTQTDLPMDVRDELLRLGCSMSDYVFHVYKQRQQDDLSDDPKSWMHRAVEIETGVGAWGVTVREALDRYFRDDLLDHRSVPDADE